MEKTIKGIIQSKIGTLADNAEVTFRSNAMSIVLRGQEKLNPPDYLGGIVEANEELKKIGFESKRITFMHEVCFLDYVTG